MIEEIEETLALCPECLKTIKAKKIAENDTIYIVKTCPDHGTWKVKIWNGITHYRNLHDFAAVPKVPEKFAVSSTKNCPYDCGLCSQHLQHSCVNVVEITNHCNLNCPICFASSETCGYDFHPDIATIRRMFQTVVDFVDSPRCVQISGGEPTIRDDLPEIVKIAKSMGIEHIEINTNAIRIGKDLNYLQELKKAGVDDFYMQFDGVKDSIYLKTRGRSLFALKEQAIQNCKNVGIGVTLVVTVSPNINLDHVGEIIKYGASKTPTVKGVHFQPISYFGRYSIEPTNENRITLPELAHAIEVQTGGMLKADNFLPTSCSNVHCDMKSLSIVLPDGSLFPLTTMALGPPKKIDNIANKTRAEISQFWRFIECSMDGENTEKSHDNSWKTFINRAKTHYLTVSAMAFQDVWTGEVERWKRCCIHVATPDGKLIPFCLFNTTASGGTTLYRERTFHQQI